MFLSPMINLNSFSRMFDKVTIKTLTFESVQLEYDYKLKNIVNTKFVENSVNLSYFLIFEHFSL